MMCNAYRLVSKDYPRGELTLLFFSVYSHLSLL
jgi:hypothetical protein